MKLHKRVPVEIDNKQYEIRVMFEEGLVNVAAFHNNYPANGFRHQILLSKATDVQTVLESDAVAEIVEMAKNDIDEERWNKLGISV